MNFIFNDKYTHTCINILTEISASSLSCPIFFGGTFSLLFNVSCSEEFHENQACTDYINVFGSAVVLSYDFNYADNFNCSINSNRGIVQLSAALSFFTDETFAVEHGSNYEYVRGTDYMYIEIEVDIPTNAESLQLSLVNVWLCTCDPADESQMFISETDASNSGCFNPAIVDAGSLSTVLLADVSQSNYDAQIIAENSTKIVRFSFLTPAWTGRAKMFVQSQIEVALVENIPRRRRLLAEHKIQYNLQVLSSAFMAEKTKINVSGDKYSVSVEVIFAIGVSIAVIVIFLVAIGIFIKKKWNFMKSQLSQSKNTLQFPVEMSDSGLEMETTENVESQSNIMLNIMQSNDKEHYS